MKYLTVLTLLLSALPSGAPVASTGTVAIVGYISTGGCDMGVKGGMLNSDCYSNGQWIRQTQPLNDLSTNNRLAQTLETEINWLDKNQKKGIIVISYH